MLVNADCKILGQSIEEVRVCIICPEIYGCIFVSTGCVYIQLVLIAGKIFIIEIILISLSQ